MRICKRCGGDGELNEAGLCGECEREPAFTSGVMKTSTIVVAAGERTDVFRSIKEVPPSLRRQLRRATNGVRSGTILIADKRGREEIARALRKLPGQSKSEARHFWGPRGQQILAVLLILCTLMLIGAVITHRF